MSIWISKRLRRQVVTLAAFALLCGSLSSLSAGEAIQFSPSKSKDESSTPNNKLPKEKLSNLDRLPSSNPLDAANQVTSMGEDPRDPRRPKTKEEKRRKLEELEKKNWTAVEPGQLQEEEDEKTSMGVREYDIETSGKEKNAPDIWLDRKRSANSSSQSNPRSRGTAVRGPSQSRPQPVRESDGSDPGLKISIVGSQTSGRSVGTPGAGELKLNNILVSDPAPGGLRDAFSAASSDQNRRGDLGLRSIGAPDGSRPSSLGGSDSLGFGRDQSARSALPASGLLDTPKSQLPGGGSGFGLSGNRYSSPALNDGSLGSRSGFGSAPSTLLQPQNNFSSGSSRDAFAPPARPSSGR